MPDLAVGVLQQHLVHPRQVGVDVVSGLPGAPFGDPHDQQRQSAEQNMGLDTLIEAVVDRPQLDDPLHVTEGALGLQEVLVA